MLVSVFSSRAQEEAINAATLIETSINEQGLAKTQNTNEILIKQLEADIPILMEKAMIPGSSIALIKNGEIIWSKDFGVKSMESMEPAPTNTIYPAASLTKAFFSYLVMKMVDSGELDLDKPLVDYVPTSKIENMLTHSINVEGFRVEWLNKITARMALSHTSGFMHGYIAVSVPYPLSFEPGTQYQYSSDGYGFLSMVIEHIRNEPLETLMLEEVIKPLEMNNTYMIWQDRFETNIAYGHDMCMNPQNKLSKSYTASPAAGLYTTAEDYAKFVLNIINGQDINKNTILDFLRPQISLGNGVSWSSGFGIDSTMFGDMFWHTGDIGNYRHFFIANKKEKYGLIYLTNSHNGLRIANELSRRAFGIKCNGLNWQGYENFETPNFKIIQAINKTGKENAFALMKDLVQSNPEEGENLIRGVGNSLMNCMKFEEAIEILKEGIKLYPNAPRLYSALASASYRKGDYDEAIDNFRHALNIDKDNAVYFRYLQYVQLSKTLTVDSFDNALANYSKLINDDPGNFNELNLWRYGNRLLRSGRVKDAIEIFKVNLHFNKESSDAYLSMGDGYAAINENELALKYIKKALEISPGNAWAKQSLNNLIDK